MIHVGTCTLLIPGAQEVLDHYHKASCLIDFQAMREGKNMSFEGNENRKGMKAFLLRGAFA